MILIGVAAATVVAALAASAQPSSAQMRRWCTQGPIGSFGTMRCEFNTYEQCRATASGLNRTCIENPEIAWARRYGNQRNSRNNRQRRDSGNWQGRDRNNWNWQ
jgi:hypothetical protein